VGGSRGGAARRAAEQLLASGLVIEAESVPVGAPEPFLGLEKLRRGAGGAAESRSAIMSRAERFLDTRTPST